MTEEKNIGEKSETITIKKDALWKYSTFALIGLLVLVVVFFVLPGKSSNGNVVAGNNAPNLPSVGAGEKVDIKSGDAPVLGSKSAAVEIIEFSDYQCPFCRKFWSETLPSIQRDYIDSGKVKLVYKDFPLGFHEGAIPYAEAARCAREIGDDEAYFKMHDKIFEEQNILDGGAVRSTIPYPGDETLKQWAKDIGYDIGSCLDSGKYRSEIQKDLNEGSSAGVQGTPGFFINGKPLSGAQPYTVFKQMIDAELQ